jgi:hypothetical protein
MEILVALMWALIYCIAVGLVGYIIIWGCSKAFPEAAPLITRIVWGVVALVCMIVLVTVISGAVGNGHMRLPYLNDRH